MQQLAMLDLPGSEQERRQMAIEAISTSLLAELAVDRSAVVRLAVANNTMADGRTFAALAGDHEVAVRLAVASNPAANADVLAGLAADTNPAVRARVALHSSTSPRAMQQLVRDPNEDVLFALAISPNTTWEIQEALIEAPVRVRLGLASNKYCSECLIEKLMQDEDHTVRMVASNHPQAPARRAAAQFARSC